MLKVHGMAQTHLQKTTEEQNKTMALEQPLHTAYTVRDLVHYMDETKATGKSPKVQRKRIGPCHMHACQKVEWSALWTD